jgi:hypothetical protein
LPGSSDSEDEREESTVASLLDMGEEYESKRWKRRRQVI